VKTAWAERAPGTRAPHSASDAAFEQRLMLTALLGGEHEYPMPAALEFEPGEVDFRVQRLDMNLAVAHLHDQQALSVR